MHIIKSLEWSKTYDFEENNFKSFHIHIILEAVMCIHFTKTDTDIISKLALANLNSILMFDLKSSSYIKFDKMQNDRKG